MSDNNNTNNSISRNHFLEECIDLAIDGFLFRGITPSEHYYHFSRSFPQALTLSSNLTITFKESSHHQQQTKNAFSFDLSLLPVDDKLSLTRLSSKLSNSRTSISNQFLSKNSIDSVEPFKSTLPDLSSLENEVHKIEERMRKHRLKHHRPDHLSQMTIKQILEEKTNAQQELLRFETKYSKPTKSEQKKVVKPLYDYYRQLKRLVENQQSNI